VATTVPIVVPTVTAAAAAFPGTCTATSTRSSYTQTMTRLTGVHGPVPVTALGTEALQELLGRVSELRCSAVRGPVGAPGRSRRGR
jgi:hypothetical protein